MANKEKMNEYSRVMKQKYHVAALTFIAEYRGLDKVKCVDCGIDDLEVLDIEDVNGFGRARKRLIGHSWKYLFNDVKAHPEMYTIRCATCNWIKRVRSEEHFPTSKAGKRTKEFRERLYALLQADLDGEHLTCEDCGSVFDKRIIQVDESQSYRKEYRRTFDALYYFWLMEVHPEVVLDLVCPNCHRKRSKQRRRNKQ
jgi:hypothetical protein